MLEELSWSVTSFMVFHGISWPTFPRESPPLTSLCLRSSSRQNTGTPPAVPLCQTAWAGLLTQPPSHAPREAGWLGGRGRFGNSRCKPGLNLVSDPHSLNSSSFSDFIPGTKDNEDKLFYFSVMYVVHSYELSV